MLGGRPLSQLDPPGLFIIALLWLNVSPQVATVYLVQFINILIELYNAIKTHVVKYDEQLCFQ